jgi:tRNA(Ile)-lysidine synthase
MDLTTKVRNFLERNNLLSVSDAVLVALSGGPDSVALLYVLQELQTDLDLRLEVAHLQHGIRGEEGREDARFVARLCEQLGLRCHIHEIDLPQMKAKAGAGNIEAMARQQRYDYFAELAQLRRFQKVATAHSLNDQAETLLMRLFRGSGRTGLGGIAPVRNLPGGQLQDLGILLIRPFLAVSRGEVLQFLHERRISYRTDSSNANSDYLRNWTRLDLIPQLKQKFGDDIILRLSQQAEVIRAEEAYLNSRAHAELRSITIGPILRRGLFLKLNEALKRKVLRLWLKEHRGTLHGIDFDHVALALQFIAGDRAQGRLDLPGGWALVREYDVLTLAKRLGNFSRQCYSYALRPGIQLSVQEAGLMIESRILSAPPPLPATLMEAVFDTALIAEEMIVRNFRNGDRIRPMGLSGQKKVKDLFIDHKVPLEIRAVTPLLTAGKEILWIPGYGRSEIATVTAATKAFLRFEARPITN